MQRVGEVFGKREGRGNAALAFLISIMNAAQTELRAVAQELQKVAGAAAAGDDENVMNARFDQTPYRIVDHRLIEHWQ